MEREKTKLKDTKEALKQTEQDYEALMSSIDGIVWEADTQSFQFLFVSKQAERLLGYPISQWLTEPSFWQNHIHPNDRDKTVAFCLKATEERRSHELEYRMIAANGQHVWLRDIITVVVEDDQPVKLRGVMVDITKRKRAEEALRKAHEELGMRIQERTAELMKANRTLTQKITQHKQTEEALRDSEERFRLLAQTANDAIVTINSEGDIAFWNSAAETIFGYSHDEAIGKPITFVIPKRFHKAHENGMKQLVLTGKSKIIGKIYEVIGLRKDGGEFPIELSTTSWKIREELFFTGIVRDITERLAAEQAGKRAEKELRKREQEFMALVENAPDVISRFDKKFCHVYINPAVIRESGKPPDFFIGKTNQELGTPEELIVEWHQALKSVFETGREITIETKYPTPTGTKYYSNRLAPEFSEDGSVETVLNISRDITERKRAEEELRKHQGHLEELVDERTTELRSANLELRQEITARLSAEQAGKHAEEALRQSEEEYRILFELGSDAFLTVIPPKGEILDANKAAVQMLGYSKEELKKLSGGEIMAPDVVADTNREWQRQVEEKGHFLLETVWVRKDGSHVPVEVGGKPFELGNQSLLQLIGRDITERKKVEERLLDYQKQLQSLASELSLAEERERKRIATELHDRIAQSLAFTKIKLGILREKVSSSDSVSLIEELNETFEQLIQDTRSLTFELASPILYELGLEKAIEWLAEYIQKESAISVNFKSDEQDKHLSEDVRITLFQAVREAMINAVKHAQANNIKVSVEKIDDVIRIQVVDDGIGFDVAEMLSPGERGRGFGLFSIRERIKYLGGEFEVHSNLGLGTRIILKAPLSSEKS